MDCCLCEQSAHLFRARNSLCARCFEGAKEIIEFSSRLDCVLLSGSDGRSTQLLLELAGGAADDADNVRYRPDSHGFLVVSGNGSAADHLSANNANNNISSNSGSSSSSSSNNKQNHAIKPENLSSSSSSSSSSRRTYSTSRLPTTSTSITKSLASTTTPKTKVYFYAS